MIVQEVWLSGHIQRLTHKCGLFSKKLVPHFVTVSNHKKMLLVELWWAFFAAHITLATKTKYVSLCISARVESSQTEQVEFLWEEQLQTLQEDTLPLR